MRALFLATLTAVTGFAQVAAQEPHPLQATDRAGGIAARVVPDPEQLPERSRLYRILVQGSEVGSMRTILTVSEDTVTYEENTELPVVGLRQTTRARFLWSSLSMLSLEQAGHAGAQEARTSLTFTPERVYGRAQFPGAGGAPTVLEIDTVFAPGTLDINLIQPLLPTLPLTTGAQLEITVFNAADASTRPVTLSIDSVEGVVVPAGSFTAFRVQALGGPQAMLMHVDTREPRSVVRIEVLGPTPIVFELTEET